MAINMKPSGAKLQLGKHLQLSKTQKTIMIAAGIGVFVVVFTLIAAKDLIGQISYQGRVISAQKTALAQLHANEAASKNLVSSYDAFINNPINALGGSSTGSGSQDGNNAVLVQNALPTSYDFPALTSSLEKLISNTGMTIQSITGQDQQAEQQSNTSSSNPQPVAIPFSISAQGSVTQAQSLVSEFEHSIRPFQIQTLELKGDQNSMTVNITAQTYFQPAKNFNITEKAVQ